MRLFLAALRRYIMATGMFWVPFAYLRVCLLRICGVKIGTGCYIGFNIIIDSNYPELIEIGNDVTISHNTLIYAHTASPAKSYLGEFYFQVKSVKVDNGAWIGSNCTILPGVTIGKNSMIGAGSVVTKDTHPYSLYAGNPCKKIKELPIPPTTLVNH